MILPKRTQTTAAVADHYDELDRFYREVWGEHVHHGYWVTGQECPADAAVALIELLADRLDLAAGQLVCDIGCGYGATARFFAEQFGVAVTGVTVSAAQARFAQERQVLSRRASIEVRDWMENGFADGYFDRAYAVESSEHMPDKQRFFDEAFRVLRPGGRLAVCAWLACDAPRAWEVRHLLEPICREGRLPSMGNEGEYRGFAERAGFHVLGVEDISDRVSRTWWICIRRGVAKLLTDARYRRFLLDGESGNRIFAVTMFRLLIAYRTRSMRYCLLLFGRN